MTNTAALGRILYTQYVYFFQAAGFILLTAMIGSIVLTLRSRRGVKRQSIDAQNLRDRKVAVQLRKVPSRAGCDFRPPECRPAGGAPAASC